MIPTLEDNRARWSAFASEFSTKKTAETNQVAYPLAVQLNLTSATSHVVEIGTGGGGLTEILRFLTPAHVPISSFDIAPSFFPYATARLERHGTPLAAQKISLVEASADRLPLADGSCDRVAVNMVYHLIPDPDAALREAYRVLKPNGVLAFSVWGPRESAPYFTLGGDVADRFCASDAKDKEVARERSNFHLQSRGKCVEMAKSAGFPVVRGYHIPCNASFKTAKEAAEYLVDFGPFMVQLRAKLGERWQDYVGELEKEVQKLYDRGDSLGYLALLVVCFK